MIKYSFTKMNGAGNDFIMIDRDANPPLNLSAELIQKLCDRHFGIGADGVITVRRSIDTDFVMEYFNSDGSSGSLCGNGARCAVKFSHICGKFSASSTRFLCNNTSYSAELLPNNSVRFYLNPPSDIKTGLRLETDEYTMIYHFVNTGSPHAVVFSEDIFLKTAVGRPAYSEIQTLPVKTLGREIRYHNAFPEGTNVNFVRTDGTQVLIRTYERGVEDETLACGTGSVAAAVICSIVKAHKAPIVLSTASRKSLSVNFNINETCITEVSLTGPAEINFEGFFDC